MKDNILKSFLFPCTLKAYNKFKLLLPLPGIEAEEEYMYVIETEGSLKGMDELVNEHEITDKSTFGVVKGAVPGTEYFVKVR